MENLVQKIVEKAFAALPTSVEEIKGKGKNNLVFKIRANDQPFILRISNRDGTLKLYQKEKWCAETAIEAGLPTPRVLQIGTLDGYAFSFQEYIEGVTGTDTPDELEKIWFTLGQWAKLINQIPAPDLAVNYDEVVKNLFADKYFEIRDIFSKEVSLKIKNRLEETISWSFSPMLCHGNLHPSNTIIHPSGVIYVIDWETATGNKTPQSELAEIYTWNNGRENIAHFCKSYGLDDSLTRDMMRDIQTLVLLRLVQVIVRKMPADNNWKHDDYIQETATKLSSIEDYQQDILFTKNL